ncbi:MAG TPA: hypothetical protein VLL73_06475 [Desulfurivibrionaceae bacterium]|nr:hypothetical protein [Desulfurivibrionaceae bacterium]
MELHDPSLHQKLIEMCDCYLDTNYHVKLQAVATATPADAAEESIRYLALALLHAITEKAGKLSFKRKKEHCTVTIQVEDDKISLPTPPRALFDGIMSAMRTILHAEGNKTAMPLALGLRSGDIELQVKLEQEKDKESLKFKLPQF